MHFIQHSYLQFNTFKPLFLIRQRRYKRSRYYCWNVRFLSCKRKYITVDILNFCSLVQTACISIMEWCTSLAQYFVKANFFFFSLMSLSMVPPAFMSDCYGSLLCTPLLRLPQEFLLIYLFIWSMGNFKVFFLFLFFSWSLSSVDVDDWIFVQTFSSSDATDLMLHVNFVIF